MEEDGENMGDVDGDGAENDTFGDDDDDVGDHNGEGGDDNDCCGGGDVDGNHDSNYAVKIDCYGIHMFF